MSIFHAVAAICGGCGTEVQVERTASVNADRRPDLRADILDGSFQAVDCPSCGARIRLPPHLIYLDMNRGDWIAAEPTTLLEEWPSAEAEAQAAYDIAFGADAPKAAREIGVDLRPRLVFGWAALREKLLANDLGLDDVALELLKIALMREVAGPPIADETELRLVGGDDTTLAFAWFVARSERRLTELSVPRDIYDDVAGDTDSWALLRGQLAGHLMVDLRRLVAGPG